MCAAGPPTVPVTSTRSRLSLPGGRTERDLDMVPEHPRRRPPGSDADGRGAFDAEAP